MSSYLNYQIEVKQNDKWISVGKPLWCQGFLRDCLRNKGIGKFPDDLSEELSEYLKSQEMDYYYQSWISLSSLEDLEEKERTYLESYIKDRLREHELALAKYLLKDKELPYNNIIDEYFNEVLEDYTCLSGFNFMLYQLTRDYTFNEDAIRIIYWIG